MPFNLVPVINVHSFEGYDIKYEELNQRLNHVKKEFGLRRAVSTHTLTGETRTFAEILDLQVETIVLYYLEIQGLLSRQLRILRSEQVEKLQACNVSMPIIDDFCHKYRIIGLEILDLLHYLEKNSLSLRKILHRHDALFDQKMGSMYFDTRFNGSSKNSQLRQLYHQEGVKALVASIRRGFEELYDARNVLIQPQQLLYATDGRDSPLLGRSFDGSIIGPSGKQTHKLIPKVSFRKRLASFSSLHHLFQQTQASEGTTSDNNSNNNNTSNNLSSLANNGSSETTPLNQDSMKRNVVSTNDLDQLLNSANHNNNNNVPYTRQRSLSDLEPILHQISDVANKLLKTQSKTTVEFLSSYGAMGLELSMNEIRRAVQGDDTSSGKTSSPPTSLAGLYLNLFVTFIYLANQYIVAPTSAQYAAILGLGPSMSGMIIGLAPVAALLSAFIYSQWSNTSFKHPLLFSIFFGILGNLLYALALQCRSTLLLFLGRLVTGFGGTRVVSRRYIADHVAIEDRLLASSQFVTAGAMGLAFGPLLASLIERSNVSFTMYGFDGKTVLFIYENVNAPGWIMTVLWAISFFAVLLYFEEPKIAEKKPSPKPASYTTEDIVFVETGNELWGSNNDPMSTTNHGVEMKSTAHKHVPFHESLKQKHMGGSFHANETTPMLGHSALRSNYGNNDNDLFINNGGYSLRPKAKSKEPSCFEFITFEVYVLLFILTVNKTGQELAISSMPFLGREVFNLSVESPGYYMALIGTLVLPTNIFVSQMFKDMEERDIVLRLSYFILFGIGLICHFGAFGDYSLFQYIFGTSVVFTYLNSLEGVIMSLLSKLISPDLAKGTFNSGLLATEAGTLGRVLGDMAITVFGNDSSRSPMLVNQLYLPFAMLVVTTVLLMQQFYERFVE